MGINLTGQRYGRLVVIGPADTYISPQGKRSLMWQCLCDCGKYTISKGTKLKNGDKVSCGCFKSENIRPKYESNSPSWTGYKDISGSIWGRIKQSAQNRDIPFEITIEQAWDLFLKQEKKCALSGVDINFAILTKDRLNRQNTASLDRIDNSSGYTIDNIQWVHVKINYMKNKMDQNEFIDWCKKVTSHTAKAMGE